MCGEGYHFVRFFVVVSSIITTFLFDTVRSIQVLVWCSEGQLLANVAAGTLRVFRSYMYVYIYIYIHIYIYTERERERETESYLFYVFICHTIFRSICIHACI